MKKESLENITLVIEYIHTLTLYISSLHALVTHDHVIARLWHQPLAIQLDALSCSFVRKV